MAGSGERKGLDSNGPMVAVVVLGKQDRRERVQIDQGKFRSIRERGSSFLIGREERRSHE
jgi:hypothetical protein